MSAPAIIQPSREPRRREYVERHKALEEQRTSNGWDAIWKKIREYLAPSAGRFYVEDHNRNKGEDSEKIDGTGRRALGRLSAGLGSGLTSPARPWFRMTTRDLGQGPAGIDRQYLHLVENTSRATFQGTNLYTVFPLLYKDIGAFGTGAIGSFEDWRHVFRIRHYPIGTYCLDLGPDLAVDTFFRRFRLTTRQVVERYGLERCSRAVRGNYKEPRSHLTPVDLAECYEPNPDADPRSDHPSRLPFRGLTWEVGADEDQFLAQSGFHEFPIHTPRWEVIGEDTYGYSPAMQCLGDVIALELLQSWKLEGVEFVVNPPMTGPNRLAALGPKVLPGATAFVDSPAGQPWQPAVVTNGPQILAIKDVIAEHQQRISEAFYEDLFVALLSSGRSQITAREVEELHQEKFMMLGPILHQLNNELFKPLIERTYAMQVRAGRIPAPPQEIQGKEWDIEFISVLAAAQRRQDTYDVERIVQVAASMVQIWPEVSDKIESDKVIDEYAEMIAVSPRVLRAEVEIQRIRQQRQQAAQAQQMAALAQPAQQGAEALHTLSRTDVTGDSALQRLAAIAGAPNPPGVQQ